jgi:23S rRNA pseudouridine2604 synthase
MIRAAMSNDGERLSKRVMQLKGCSRREAEQFIEGGWVTVNGVVVEEPPFRVHNQTVQIAADATLLGAESVTLLLHKPPGWLDGVDEGEGVKGGAKSARQLLTLANHWTEDGSGIRILKRHLNHLESDVPLETGASGLAVFTQDWRTRRKLSEDIGSMEHELVADVAGEVSPEAMQLMTRALKDQRNPLPSTKFSVGSTSPERSKLRFAVKGAHPGLVAHLCERGGLTLLALRRIRLGRVALSDLPVGHWRYLASFEKF